MRAGYFSEAQGGGSLFPLYIGRPLPDGGVRPPDVTWFSDDNGVKWIRGIEDREGAPDWREGVSTSMTRGRFGYQGRFYFLLPVGTRRLTSSTRQRKTTKATTPSAAKI